MADYSFDASVLIASYNNRATLIPCVERLMAQTYPPERFEVIVILDGSTDDSYAALTRVTVPFRFTIVQQANQGKAVALNYGASIATGRYLIIIDSDILTNVDFVKNHVAAHERGDVVIGPIPLADCTPTNFMTDGVRAWADEYTQAMLQHRGDYTCTEIFGANLSIGRDAFNAIGGYRADLRRTQDLHIGKKIINAGYKVVFCPDAVAAQIFDKSFPAWCENLYYDGRSHYLLIQEYPEERQNFKIGQYYPLTLTKRILRPLIIRRTLIGNGIIAVAKIVLERCRCAGLRWRTLTHCQGAIGDALYWRGVYEAVNDPARFAAFIAGKAL